LHDDDLSPGHLFQAGLAPVSQIRLQATARRSPLAVAAPVGKFAADALDDAASRWRGRSGGDGGRHDGTAPIVDWARANGLEQVVTSYAPTGPTAECLDALETALESAGIRLVQVPQQYDLRAWPHATHGFFRFKERIPELIAAMGLKPAGRV
jgi:deoxyribodipyrimidine photo-lyase